MDEQIIRGLERPSSNINSSLNSSMPSPLEGNVLSAEQAMGLALQEAAKGQYKVSPNPAVGCVVLDGEGRFLSSGYHEYFGGPHAEVNALKHLTVEQLRGAQVYVTLEPCAHEGKTPSCAKMLVKFPISKVVYGLKDPNPLVAGQGAAILKQSGIAAELFPSESSLRLDLEEICESFLWNQNCKRPFVALKIAASLDSQLALASGQSKWITGEQARHYAHHLRASYDGLMVSGRTVLVDNPSLNIRGIETDKTNFILILDRQGDVLERLAQLQLLKFHKIEKIILFADEKLRDSILKKKEAMCLEHPSLQSLKIEFIESSAGQLDLEAIIARCWQLKIFSILIESGARLAGALLEAGLIQRLYLFQSLSLFGADQNQSWTRGLKILEIHDRIWLQNPRIMGFSGQDFLLTARLNRK